MTFLTFVNQLLSLGVILTQISMAIAILSFFLFRKNFDPAGKLLGKHGILLAFSVAFVSTAASLFYSQIVGFAPCDLCWFQRIFMYPEVILLGAAMMKKDYQIVDYALPLAIIGFFISLYHNYMYYYNNGLSVFCNLGGSQVSCIKRYVFEFGYVTIPMMALTGFALVIGFLLLQKVYGKK